MTPVRVLVVDDSVVIRRLVSEALGRDPRIEVVGTASNGRLALARVEQLAPDVVTMDIEMPEMDGIEAVRELRRSGHRMPIIMFSTLTERGAVATLDALAAGATDYVAKPTGGTSVTDSLQRVGDELVPKVLALVGARAQRRTSSWRPDGTGPAVRVPCGATLPAHAVRLVVVGSSTGGPEALSRFVGGFTAPPPVPVLVVQHMPPVFTRQLAARLDRLGPATVVEATAGDPLLPGSVYVAPGDHHLVVRGRAAGLAAGIDDGPPVNFCRPSVDVLFASAVDAVGGEIVGVVMTGMGADGRTGSGQIVAAGGTVLVQDEPTSVVWGMPGAVANAGFAHRVLPLAELAPALEARLRGAR
ncbi:MAG: chemotaxis response regulator protein-glutamate methylesterase [Cellulomonas sp. 73-92]|uniref:protein-glutamate methylesterase/protein-glutamine glutaminase n=1 Tax=Cellulomonas sp. 73-92 TaxID=1895740 RepID=UPI00092C3BA3|nr:chemotaxis response regulator protein-glutamate methylesterase [Cellulomonas sp. 73-92]OJV78488.1 MAG: chemotaxis response regulator protein-glutamate methylesterase [Cellulomonas sp. 73-92]